MGSQAQQGRIQIYTFSEVRLDPPCLLNVIFECFQSPNLNAPITSRDMALVGVRDRILTHHVWVLRHMILIVGVSFDTSQATTTWFGKETSLPSQGDLGGSPY